MVLKCAEFYIVSQFPEKGEISVKFLEGTEVNL